MYSYQLLKGYKHYVASILTLKYFPVHLHHELELIFCITGSIIIKKNGIPFTVNKDEFIIIENMELHEVFCEDNTTALLIEVGTSFLHNDFLQLNNIKFRSESYNFHSNELLSFTYAKNLKSLFLEIINELQNKQPISDLIIKSNLYRICAILIKDLPKSTEQKINKTHEITAIEKALELVYYNYDKQLTVEYVADTCGYGVSNFCKIFKNVIGKSFHTYLNQFRIKNARYLLSDTNKSIKEISQLVGFNETKTFCRVFKSFSNMTAQNYRLENRKNSDV